MSKQKELKIFNLSECLKFLESISKINESAILTTSSSQDGRSSLLSSLVCSSDNTLFLYSEFVGCTADINTDYNIPDIKKLNRVLSTIDLNEIRLITNTNNFEYKSSALKFKYHLYEEGFLTKPPVNLEKIKNFEYHINFTINKDKLSDIIRASSFATDTNKVYLYTENNRLLAELTDRARHNTDAISLDLGDANYELSPLPLNLDHIKLLNVINSTINFGINTAYGVTVIDICNDLIKLKYVLTSLTQ